MNIYLLIGILIGVFSCSLGQASNSNDPLTPIINFLVQLQKLRQLYAGVTQTTVSNEINTFNSLTSPSEVPLSSSNENSATTSSGNREFRGRGLFGIGPSSRFPSSSDSNSGGLPSFFTRGRFRSVAQSLFNSLFSPVFTTSYSRNLRDNHRDNIPTQNIN